MRKFRSSFVSSASPSWLNRLAAWLFPPRPVQTSRRPSTKPAIIYTELPPHVVLLRQRGKEARQLLNRYLENRPVSRREWVKAGLREGSWRRARRILISAHILSRDGELRYTGRDAVNRLYTHLDRIEQQCYQRGCFVSPW